MLHFYGGGAPLSRVVRLLSFIPREEAAHSPAGRYSGDAHVSSFRPWDRDLLVKSLSALDYRCSRHSAICGD